MDVPDHALPPEPLRAIYNVQPLTNAGFTGKGTTIVVFAFDGFDQADLDTFTQTYQLPKFTPEVVGGMPEQRSGEATMDLQVAHAVAPDAHKVLVNARTTVDGGGGTYVKIAKLMESVDRQFPGAVWTLSIGWGCGRMITAADLAPIRAAISAAAAHGTTVFNASGDLAGLECKRGHDWAAPPGPSDVGLDAVASLPEVTNVGGTTLTTDDQYRWLAEHAWSDGPLTQGSGGGVSSLFDRPIRRVQRQQQRAPSDSRCRRGGGQFHRCSDRRQQTAGRRWWDIAGCPDMGRGQGGAAGTRTRIVVLAAVKNDLALIGVAIGPYHRFAPGDGPGVPSGANLELAQDLGKYVNSFVWRGDSPR